MFNCSRTTDHYIITVPGTLALLLLFDPSGLKVCFSHLSLSRRPSLLIIVERIILRVLLQFEFVLTFKSTIKVKARCLILLLVSCFTNSVVRLQIPVHPLGKFLNKDGQKFMEHTKQTK